MDKSLETLTFEVRYRSMTSCQLCEACGQKLTTWITHPPNALYYHRLVRWH